MGIIIETFSYLYIPILLIALFEKKKPRDIFDEEVKFRLDQLVVLFIYSYSISIIKYSFLALLATVIYILVIGRFI